MVDLNRRVVAQCIFLREHYRPCAPRSAHPVRSEVGLVSNVLGVAIAELSLPFADSDVALSAHFEPANRIPDLVWRSDSLPMAFFPRIDFPSLLPNSASGAPRELLFMVKALLSELSRFYEALLPRASFLGGAWRLLKEHEIFRSRSRWEILVSRSGEPDRGPVPDRLERSSPLSAPEIIEAVTIAFVIPLESGSLPAFLVADNVSEDFECCLLFKFTRPGSNSGSALSAEAVERCSPRLLLSPSLRNFLTTVGCEVRLPHFNTPVTMPEPHGDDRSGQSHVPSHRLLDYALFVHETLQQAVSKACNSCAARRRILSMLLHRLRGAVLEFDAELYRSAAFLLEWHDFYFILRFQMQEFFPHQQQGPQISLRSIYHTEKNALANTPMEDERERDSVMLRHPFERSFQDEVPHSPRWEAQEFADRWLRFVREALPKFQADSVRNNSI